MNQYSRNRQFPTGNPIANALVVVVGALAVGLAFVLGVAAFIALAAVMLVLGAIIGIRIWWLNRKLGMRPRPEPTNQPTGVIEGEYRVVSDDNATDSDPQ